MEHLVGSLTILENGMDIMVITRQLTAFPITLRLNRASHHKTAMTVNPHRRLTLGESSSLFFSCPTQEVQFVSLYPS